MILIVSQAALAGGHQMALSYVPARLADLGWGFGQLASEKRHGSDQKCTPELVSPGREIHGKKKLH